MRSEGEGPSSLFSFGGFGSGQELREMQQSQEVLKEHTKHVISCLTLGCGCQNWVPAKWLALVNGNMDDLTCDPIPGGLILTHIHLAQNISAFWSRIPLWV